jgi:hypothetical protein
MTEEQAQEPVSFAATVVAYAAENEFSPTTVFNGLAIATAALLVDYISDDEGNVDEMSMKYAITNFITGLTGAVEFSKAQVKLVVESGQLAVED